jgi:hypothetical protein
MRPWHKNEEFNKKCYYLESHNNIRKQTNKQTNNGNYRKPARLLGEM